MKSNINKTIIQKLLNQATKDGIQKIVVGAVIKRDDKFLLLKRAPFEFMGGLIELPSGTPDAGEDLLHALAREVKEETNLVVTVVIVYLGLFDYVSSSGKKTRQFNFLVKTGSGDIKLNPTEHCNYYLLNPSDKEFSKLNISNGTKAVLSIAETK
ncbi:MAG: ADP-ribose pyrophosphatase [Parcubacteria group bacterium Licking1014_1]|nr:MAG: ADP-ribose pyrophosphatase [Parcubacteria group bacterium Licking1014_1]